MKARILWAPPPNLTISQWADNKRQLSSESSQSPGQWTTDRVPYLREIMDTISSPRIRKVVFMAPSQTAKTEILLNTIGYFADMEPCPILAVFPTDSLVETFSKDRLAPMIRDTVALRGKVRDVKGRTSGNTIYHKKFPGGHISMTGANSPANLAMRPVRVLLLDEVDRFPISAGTEGDPIKLAVKRTQNFHNRKIVITASPTIKNVSVVEREYELSDMRVFYVPCPDCKKEFLPSFKNLHWTKTDSGEHITDDAHMVCPACGVVIPESKKYDMLKSGYWKAQKKTTDTAGFHFHGVMSPWMTWKEIAKEFIQSKDNPETLKVFVNTTLGESFEERGDAPEWERIYMKREQYPVNVMPPKCYVLCSGVDVQKDRIELEIVGYGRGMESWSVSYRILTGNPEEELVWNKLQAVLEENFMTKAGAVRIASMAVDTGYLANHVYNFARRNVGRVIAVKGRNSLPAIIGKPSDVDISWRGQRISNGAKLWPVDVTYVKKELYSWLRLEKREGHVPGYCHFPDHPEEFFRQLTAEELRIVRQKSGAIRQEWVKVRERNEALDCRVYARAAAAQIGLDKYTSAQWDQLESYFSGNRPTSQPAKNPGKVNRGIEL